MVYPENIEIKLGFDKVRELLADQCQGILGRQLIDKMEFHNDYETISSLTEQTEEFKKLIETGQSPPESYYFDISAYLAKASIVNNFLVKIQSNKHHLLIIQGYFELVKLEGHLFFL